MTPEKPAHVDEKVWQQHLAWREVTNSQVKENIERYSRAEMKNGRRVSY